MTMRTSSEHARSSRVVVASRAPFSSRLAGAGWRLQPLDVLPALRRNCSAAGIVAESLSTEGSRAFRLGICRTDPDCATADPSHAHIAPPSPPSPPDTQLALLVQPASALFLCAIPSSAVAQPVNEPLGTATRDSIGHTLCPVARRSDGCVGRHKQS